MKRTINLRNVIETNLGICFLKFFLQKWKDSITIHMSEEGFDWKGGNYFIQKDEWLMYAWLSIRDGNGVGRRRVSLSHTYPRRKNSSASPYPNPTGIKLLYHPYPHRVMGIFSYPYPYPFSNYFNINFYKRNKNCSQGNIILSNIQY